MTSKSHIDRLGDRLKIGRPSESDLKDLDGYRRATRRAYDLVISEIRSQGFPVTGRPAKSTRSIVDKLNRESCRLSQVQDIAGCRVVVSDISAQTSAVERIAGVLPRATIVDRREKSTHGYRAVHIVVRAFEIPIEVQVRSIAQHTWAELSEKLSDLEGSDVKYGGGPESTRKLLSKISKLIWDLEKNEKKIALLEQTVSGMEPSLQALEAALANAPKTPEGVQAATDAVLTTAARVKVLAARGRQETAEQRANVIAIVNEYIANPE